MLSRIDRLVLIWSGAWVVATAAGVRAQTIGQIRFNRDVHPILSENCLRCHGPDKNQRKAKLRLDVREGAIERHAIVPGKPEESEIVKHIYSTKADEIMPPPESNKKLSLEQKNLLKQWIAQGAQYEPHWAYIKPVRPTPPPVSNSKWAVNPIDAFILSVLEARKIEPSPGADRRTILRRLSLDLTGLPPTPEEVAGFLRDSGAEAYERQVDRLLASPHFGERMAVPWLDAVRFADTVGYHGDQGQRIFPYRDYVIDSFNRNKPFDQFTIEQIAGDLLPNASVEQKIASGFNRLNMMTREGGAQPKEYLAKYAADRVRTLSGAWLGSTMGCCECHDHKFDPFATKDFYQMEAFFADIQQWGYYAEKDNPELKGFDDNSPFPPEIEAPNRFLERRLAQLNQQIEHQLGAAAAKLKSSAQFKARYHDWAEAGQAFLAGHPSGWLAPEPTIKSASKKPQSAPNTNFVINADNSISFAGANGDTQITVPLPAIWIAALRIELIPDKNNGGSVVRGKDRATSISFSAHLKAVGSSPETTLDFAQAEADHKAERYFNGDALIGVKDEWKTSEKDYKQKQAAIWVLKQPFQAKAGDSLTLKLRDNKAARLRIAVSPLADTDPLQCANGQLRKALETWRLTRTPAQRRLVERAYLLGTGWEAGILGEIWKLQEQASACHGGRAYTMVTAAVAPRVIRVLPRGNWQDEHGEIVEPAVPHFLPQVPNPAGRRLTRLDLARWLVSADNPLTARAVMNRLWKQFFGAGISAVVDDLGAQGEWPTHPELLDWLAVEFEQSGWDWKHIVKLMVMSSTYRQSSGLRAELREADPNNRLLSCQSPRRLDAEFVRDNALSIAGLLNRQIGGPSTHPYQPAGYYANLQFPDRDYHADTDEGQYRRGVYTHWQRTFLQPMLANFDAPSREESACTRNLSNTPQQALTLLNDPTFVEGARVMAQHLLSGPADSDAARLDAAYERALARPIKPEEKQSLLGFLAGQREHYQANREEASKLLHAGLAPAADKGNAPELAAWTSVCRVILNLHETITVY
jgi:hypothetical protein